jgi:hypothetical protein
MRRFGYVETLATAFSISGDFNVLYGIVLLGGRLIIELNAWS